MQLIFSPLPYHQQDTDVCCGAAVAQMLLEQIGAGTCAQPTLYLDGTGGSSGHWYMEPRALAAVLNGPRSGAASSKFAAHLDESFSAGCQRIVRALETSDTGVAAVVFNDMHWVAVSGALLRTRHVVGQPYDIAGLYINDPSPVTAALQYPHQIKSPPLPHQPHDVCGVSGGVFGTQHTYVTISGWQRSYWNERCRDFMPPAFVTVSNDAFVGPAGTDPMPVAEPSASADDHGNVPARKTEAEAAAVVDAEIAVQQNIGGPLAGPLAGARAFTTALCTDPDLDDHPYYVVKIRKPGGAAGAACVDAVNGELLSLQAPSLVPPDPPDAESLAVAAVRENASLLSDILGSNLLSDADFTTSPTLVWRPSRQSMSPFAPFVKTYVAGEALFVGFDGRVHRELETNIHA